jgi:hypothetical protein
MQLFSHVEQAFGSQTKNRKINSEGAETLIPTVFQQQALCQAAVEGEPPAVVVHM